MWNERLAALAGSYPTAILSRVDLDSGYPESVRVAVRLDQSRQAALLLDPPPPILAWRGRACLLFHQFNPRLEGLRQLVILGELVQLDDQPALAISKFVTANGREDTDEMPHASSPVHMLQFFWLGRRNARAYLARRGEPWPPIPYDDIVRGVEASRRASTSPSETLESRTPPVT
jgi:hypothetical protein